ncbi:hypothetical protein BN946_scf184938.g12 [Trametes cinnabarina]|uniref:3,4-dihydroxy-2-butanone-4-phosphate synthase n=1 Tax=Pycnoporus cinnabarinus TaxID=5643 RepID=A0A060S1J0_PYCCI|nr:hypothetical protein BN946_scf184938.g12 [Trametes cinnabarina]
MAPTAALLSSVSRPSILPKMSGPPTDFPLVPASASSSRPQLILDAPARTEFAFDPIEDAIESFARGDFLVVMDDESRENEGDLIIAASAVSTHKMAWMIKHTRCASSLLSPLSAPLVSLCALCRESPFTAICVRNNVAHSLVA